MISGLNIVNSSTKKRKLSTDDYDLSPDEADDDTTKWNLQEKLNSTRYDAQFVKFLNAKGKLITENINIFFRSL